MGGGGVSQKKLVKCKGRVTFMNTLRTGRARIFYITVDGDFSGPPPLLKNECSLNVSVAPGGGAQVCARVNGDFQSGNRQKNC